MSTNWTLSKTRAAFIDFFVQKHAHQFVVSSATIPHDDPTLLFANSGMAQVNLSKLSLNLFSWELLIQTLTLQSLRELLTLKNVSALVRVIDIGGKHNDLEDVGKDTYHHTFFEMMGSWSFGDYFKKEAISMAWSLLTEVFKLPKDRLYVTFFEGSPELGLEPDLEARNLWLQVGCLPENILPGNVKDNFWGMQVFM
jgi:alanyl-tRNA synthetase